MSDSASHAWTRVLESAQRLREAEEIGDQALHAVYLDQLRRLAEELAKDENSSALAWESLASWTTDPEDRLLYYERALRAAGRLDLPVDHSRARILVEIARLQIQRDESELARRYLMQARQEAQRQQETQFAKRGKELMESLLQTEGEAAALLAQLDDQEEEPS